MRSGPRRLHRSRLDSRSLRRRDGELRPRTAAFKIDSGNGKEALGLSETLVAEVEAKEPSVLAYIAHTRTRMPTRLLGSESNLVHDTRTEKQQARTHRGRQHSEHRRQGFSIGLELGAVSDHEIVHPV